MSLLDPIEDFQIEKFLGTWYHVAQDRIRPGTYNVVSTFTHQTETETAVKTVSVCRGVEKTTETTITATGDPVFFKYPQRKAFGFFYLPSEFVIKGIVVDAKGNYTHAVVGRLDTQDYKILARNPDVSCTGKVLIDQILEASFIDRAKVVPIPHVCGTFK